MNTSILLTLAAAIIAFATLGWVARLRERGLATARRHRDLFFENARSIALADGAPKPLSDLMLLLGDLMVSDFEVRVVALKMFFGLRLTFDSEPPTKEMFLAAERLEGDDAKRFHKTIWHLCSAIVYQHMPISILLRMKLRSEGHGDDTRARRFVQGLAAAKLAHAHA